MIDPIKEAVAEALFVYDYDEPWEDATSTSRRHFLGMANDALRAADRTDAWDLLRQLANILDGAMHLLEDAACKEAKAEAGKTFRRITDQNRLKAAKQAVARALAMQGIEP